MAPKKPSRKSNNSSDLVTTLLETAIEKIDILGSQIVGLDKKVDLHIQKTEFQFQEIANLDIEQNKILLEHHQRSTELKRDNDIKEKELREFIEAKDLSRQEELKALSRRVSKVEIPQKYLFWTRKVFAWVVTAGGAIGAIAALIYWLRGI